MFYGGRGKRGYLVANVKEHMAGICSFSACVCVCVCNSKHFHNYKERKEEEGEKVKHEQKFQNCPFEIIK